MVSILLTCGAYMHDCIIPIRGEVWTLRTSLTPPHFIKVPVPSQESERSCIRMLRVSILPRSTILIFCNCSDSVAFLVFLLDFGTVPTVWYFLFFY